MIGASIMVRSSVKGQPDNLMAHGAASQEKNQIEQDLCGKQWEVEKAPKKNKKISLEGVHICLPLLRWDRLLASWGIHSTQG